MYIQAEATARPQCHAHRARPGMQLPRASHISIGFNVAAAGTRLDPALNALYADSPRAGVNIHIARSRQVRFDVSAPGLAVERGCHTLCADVATAGLQMDAAANVSRANVA